MLITIHKGGELMKKALIKVYYYAKTAYISVAFATGTSESSKGWKLDHRYC